MKHYDTAKRIHRIGQPTQRIGMTHYEFPINEAPKDLLREGVRREGMNNYSNATTEAMRQYLMDHDVNNIIFRLSRRSIV